MLHKTEFSTPHLKWLFTLSVCLFKPFYINFNGLMSLIFVTTIEKQRPGKLFFKRFCLILPLLLLCLIFSPFALIGCLLRCAMYSVRNPYRYSEKKTAFNQQERLRGNLFGVGTMNLCLMHEYMSRKNNLSHTSSRTHKIGKQIIVDQMYYNDTKSDKVANDNAMATGVVTHFPDMDFLCIQEVWESNYSDILKAELHKIYPYIISDVGIYGKNCNYYCLNSGLMFVSKYKILDAEFKYFTTSCKQCVYSSKGLLMVKVLLWYDNIKEDKAVVAYIYTTHLQAYQGLNNTISKQLDEILQWTVEFREKTKRENDVVLFDIICGDFNVDNLSPGDKLAREHKLFNIYKDEGRVKPGVDQDWTVGTELRQLEMYNDEVTTPEGLKSCLESPLKRQQYLVDGDIDEPCLESVVYSPPKTKLCPVGGKRRIDYILYNTTVPVVPRQYKFITSLATLTDHIPVVMQFSVSDGL